MAATKPKLYESCDHYTNKHGHWHFSFQRKKNLRKQQEKNVSNILYTVQQPEPKELKLTVSQEFLTLFVKNNSTLAPYEQAKTVLQKM